MTNHRLTETELPLPAFLLLPILLLVTTQIATFIYIALASGFPLPCYDLLSMLLQYFQHGLSAAGLLALFNGHIVLLPKLLLILDLRLTGGDVGHFVVLSLLAWIGCFLILASAAWQAPLSLAWRRFLLLGLAVLMFRLFQLEAIVIPNGFNYPLSCLFATAALSLLAPPDAGPRRALFAAVCSVAAAACLANNLLLPPLLAGAALFSRQRSTNLIYSLLAGSFVTMLFAAGYLLRDRSPLVFATGSIPDIANAFVLVIGSPYAIFPAAGYAVGTSILLASALVLTVLARRRQHLCELERLAGLLLLFGLASIGLVAIARAGLGPENSLAGRYSMFNAFILTGVLLGLPSVIAELGWRRSLMPLPCVLLLVALVLLPEQRTLGRTYLRLGAEAQADARALRQGSRELALFRNIGTQDLSTAAAVNELAKRNLYGLGEGAK